MKIAVLSDLHGNAAALDACVDLAEALGAERYFLLGDYAGELPYPQEIMTKIYALARNHSCLAVRGNREEYMTAYEDGGEAGWLDNNSASGSLLAVYRELTAGDKAFFRSLPITAEYRIPGLPEILLFHGSPESTRELVAAGSAKARQIMRGIPHGVAVCGHTHRREAAEYRGHKLFIKPGSVGLPLDTPGQAQFALLYDEDGVWKYSFQQAPFDVEVAVRTLYTSGMMDHAPVWSAITEHILRTGKDDSTRVLLLAKELCRRQTGACVWPNIPEDCWRRAAEEFGVPLRRG